MKLTFLGAAGEVTGSATLLETSEARILIDFGLHQGSSDADRRNRKSTVRRLLTRHRPDAVVVTHAHIDHIGRLPLLAAWGDRMPIHATLPTVDLARLMLRDSAKIQEEDSRSENRWRQRQGRRAVAPLYEAEDAAAVLEWFEGHELETPVEIASGVTVRFRSAAHLLGAASIELTVLDEGRERRVVFSGDVGPGRVPGMRQAVPPDHADVLVIESTYGDRNHRPMEETYADLTQSIDRALLDGGKILIPSFAVGRTQGVLVLLSEMRRDGTLPDIPVYVDSPMAIEAGELYRKWYRELFSEETLEWISEGNHVVDLPQLEQLRSASASRRLNDQQGAAIIIAASGMCTGGRIVHHLKHQLWKHNTDVIFVGYQAEGSLGRKLVQGARRVTVMGASIAVKAQIHSVSGLSAHAGQQELLDWAAPLAGDRPKVFVNHGEDGPRLSLATKLAERIGSSWELPAYQTSYEI